MARIGNTTAGLSLHIYGAENAKGNVIRFREKTRGRILAVLDREMPAAVEQMREAMLAAYDQGTGKAARSLVGQVAETSSGAGVRISIGNYREVKYLTTLMPDSDFRAEPYMIYPGGERSYLTFFWKRLGRRVRLPQVQHPGFGRKGDVLKNAGQSALARMGYMVEYEVRSAVAEVQSGGGYSRVSGRR